jgi:DNA-binding CsgD family transcriptional regulator
MHGKTTKEIAELMGLAERTIDFHRAKIRKKMGLVNKKESLRTHLLSFQ